MAADPPDASKLVAQAATLFDIHDSLSKVIENLDLPVAALCDEHDVPTDWDSAFDVESMLRLFLYKEITEYSQNDLTKRIKKWPFLQQRFDLERAPTQQTISYTERRRFPHGFRQYITDVADGMREEALDHDDFRSSKLDRPEPEPDPSEIEASEQPLEKYVDEHAPQVIGTMLDQVAPAFDTGRAANTKHADRRIWEHQLMMSLMDTAGTRAAHRTFRKFRDDDLHHDTHTWAVKKLGTPSSDKYTLEKTNGNHLPGNQTTLSDTPVTNAQGERLRPWRDIAETIQPQFTDAIDRLLAVLRPTEMFTEPVVAAVDVTDDPIHISPWKSEEDIEPDDKRVTVKGDEKVPKDNYPVVVNGGEDYGDWEYQYATLTIVGRNAPLVVAVEPVRHNSMYEGDAGETIPWGEIVDRLMEQATDLVDIDMVMADSAFDSRDVFHVLDQYYDVKYLIPKQERSNNVKGNIAEVRGDEELLSRVEQDKTLHLESDAPYVDIHTDPTVGENGYSHDVTYMYVPAETDEKAILEDDDTQFAVFATNRDDDVEPREAIHYSDWYSNRWDIEIGYKTISPLVPSIASTDYRMRFFSFVFSCLLYNLWRAVDHSLKVLASEKYDDYGRGPHQERLDTVLPMADYLASSIVLLFRDGLDPPDVTV